MEYSSTLKVLVVEDNETNLYMLVRRLESRGFEIVTAINGQQGIEMAQSAEPDIVLMDMSLPLVDGWEATRILKASSRTRHIPVVALTAHALAGDREKAFAAGCDEYATKPIDFPGLLEKIQELCGRNLRGKEAAR